MLLKTKLLAICLMIFSESKSQEFTKYPNGLIYSESTMKQLHYIVDSLNFKFDRCELTRSYYSMYQATGHFISFTSKQAVEAKKAIENGISFADFISKYDAAKQDTNLLIIRFEYTDYNNEDVVEFECIGPGDNHRVSFSKGKEMKQLQFLNQWIYNFYESTDKPSLYAFFITREFKQQTIPEKYARMIQYTDCLIDTTQLIYTENADYGDYEVPNNFDKLSMDKKKKVLEEMRSTKVMGYCSMDTRPRTYALQMAQVAAETYTWEIFLRAHLNIMNDYFERASDGSYAWGARQTYLRELEELEIDIADLLFGISLRIENPSKNHYFGDVSRLGRALSEAQLANDIEAEMLSMISDEQLDDFNRLIIYYLFLNYNYYIQDDLQKQLNKNLLAEAVSTFPSHLLTHIEFEE